ncbi:hypothetical protein B6A42_01460 [Vibrio coralliilyticus]|nr:hypothetical protein B6A42_01460 [Vibrio coralliilyticus]
MAKNKDLVSVPVITYNQEEFIEETLESILNQSYNHIEIIVSDDCSTDKTVQILKNYAKKYPNIVKPIFNSDNKGITENSNTALSACRGKYIAIIGGDDLFKPNKIEKQVQFMKDTECTVSYHNAEVFDHYTGNIERLFNRPGNTYQGSAKEVISKGCFFCACTIMFRREDLGKIGFDTRLPVASDWKLIIEILARTKGKIAYLDDTLSKYRRHEHNVTRKLHKVNNAEIDTLNACNILATEYPSLFKGAMEYQAQVFDVIKPRVNYLSCLLHAIKIKPTLLRFAVLGTYILSFGKIKK